MKYSKYPSYKDSEVEWLGDLPEHWEIKKLKYSARIQGGKDQKEIVDDNGKYPIYGSGGIFGYTNHYLYNGKSVLLGRKGTVDKPLYVEGKFWTVDTMYYTILEKTTIPKWLYYSATTIKFNYYQYGSAVPSMTQEDLHNIHFSTPSAEEQWAIANYLDIATDKIDTLISKQTKLIELLKEKRQALISHAVTKGLNPHAKMKQSGVEWLGEIPEDWEVKKLKYNLGLQNQKATINGQEVIALENIESWSGRYIKTESIYQGEDVQYKKGDLLFGKLRPYLAKVFICLNNGIAFGDLLTYRPTKEMDTNFSFYCIISETFIDIVNSSTYGTKMPRASSDFIGEMYMPTPSLQEQQTIANYLDDKTSKIDTLIIKATKAISLLKERRTALISSAVTGKIDVRGIA